MPIPSIFSLLIIAFLIIFQTLGQSSITYTGSFSISLSNQNTSTSNFTIIFLETSGCSKIKCYSGYVDRYKKDNQIEVIGSNDPNLATSPIFTFQTSSLIDFIITYNPALGQQWIQIIEIGCQKFNPFTSQSRLLAVTATDSPISYSSDLKLTGGIGNVTVTYTKDSYGNILNRNQKYSFSFLTDKTIGDTFQDLIGSIQVKINQIKLDKSNGVLAGKINQAKLGLSLTKLDLDKKRTNSQTVASQNLPEYNFVPVFMADPLPTPTDPIPTPTDPTRNPARLLPVIASYTIYNHNKLIYSRIIIGQPVNIYLYIKCTLTIHTNQHRITCFGQLQFQVFGDNRYLNIFNYNRTVSTVWSNNYFYSGNYAFNTYVPFPYLPVWIHIYVPIIYTINLTLSSNLLTCNPYVYKVNHGVQVKLDTNSSGLQYYFFWPFYYRGGVTLYGTIANVQSYPNLVLNYLFFEKKINYQLDWQYGTISLTYKWNYLLQIYFTPNWITLVNNFYAANVPSQLPLIIYLNSLNPIYYP